MRRVGILISLVFIAVSVAAAMPERVYANHYVARYCVARTGSDNNAEFDACVSNNSNMTLTQYCLTRGSENSSEFDSCVSEFQHSNTEQPSGASGQRPPSGPCDDSMTFFLGFPTWYKYLELDANCEVVGPANSDGKFNWPLAAGYVGLAAVEILLRLAALFAVGFVIYGGFRYITSQGDPEGAKSARQTIINALVGLVIAIAAASIVAFIGNRLG